MKSYQQFFAELKRWKVFKVAAVYGAASFILLQMADLLGQGLRLGDTFLPFITAIVLLGFPLALILAWAFEVTPEGVHVPVRQPRARSKGSYMPRRHSAGPQA